MRWVVISLALHAALIAWLAGRHEDEQLVAWRMPTLPAFARLETTTTIELVDVPAVAGGGGGGGAIQARVTTSARHPPLRASDAWEQINVSMDAAGTSGHGGGPGGGVGTGAGNGIGLGSGGGVRVADDVPRPPPPPPVSKARPAKLVWPTRDEEVDDDANLFVARVTVDAEGFVAGARMLKARPGAKADRAANAIWTFRYSPALDDDGRAIRSTFEQSFQVR